MRGRLRTLLLGAALVLGAACARRPAVDEEAGGARLMRNLLLAREIEVVVDAGPLTEACQRLALLQSSDRQMYRVRPPAEADDERAPRIVVGTYSMGLARGLAARMGIPTGEDQGQAWFQWQDQYFGTSTDALIATFEDPDRPGLPISLVYGNDARFVERYLGGLEPGWKPGLRLYRAGALIVEAPMRLAGEVIVERIARPGVERIEILTRSRIVATNEPDLLLRVGEGLDEESAARCSMLVTRARENVRQWAAPEGPAPPLMVFVYSDLEEFARLHGADLTERINPVDRGVHMLYGASLPHADGTAAAEASALQLLDVPVATWMLEGAAVDAADVWWGRPLESWIAWLASSGLAPSVAALVDPRAGQRFSPHLLAPLRAALFRHVRATRGAGFLRQLWRGTDRLHVDLDLEQGFRATLAARAARAASELAAERTRRRSAAARVRFHGVVIEQPLAPLALGLGSAGFQRVLGETRALGADAVLLPSHLVDEPDPPALFGHARSPGVAPLEGDARITAAALLAHSAGCDVLFEPHLLSAPGGSWSGAWPRGEEAEWEHFFERYERFVVHYALLAELANAAALSIGTGLPEVTALASIGRRARHEDPVWKRAGWMRVIAAARAGFAGALTYWAASIDEAQKLGYWSDLDAIGLVLSDRLDLGGARNLAEAQSALEARLSVTFVPLAELARAYDRPVLLRADGFLRPLAFSDRARFGPGSKDVRASAFALGALANQWAPLLLQGRLNGVFLSRWSTDPTCEAASAGIADLDAGVEEMLRRVLTSW